MHTQLHDTLPPQPHDTAGLSAAQRLVSQARQALRAAPPLGDPAYTRFPGQLKAALMAGWPALRAANERDLAAARDRDLPDALVDRLRLGEPQRHYLAGLADAVSAAQPALTAPQPGRPAGTWGTLRRVARPLGVILMVYEARPTVTVEGALLNAAAGNAALLRGGRELAATNAALATLIDEALTASGLPASLVTVLDDPDRALLRALLAEPGIDALIPRGSPSLIEYCRRASTIPVIASGGGVNHLYVHASADLGFAALAALDSKLAEPTACNTVEMVLVDEAVAGRFLQALAAAAAHATEPVRILADPRRVPPDGEAGGGVRFGPLRPDDFGREFLDRTIGVHAVTGPAEALAHIARHGSGHTEGVIAGSDAVVAGFCRQVDAAAIVVNGSLRLHDGPTMRLGPELSISTGRLHVRGPVTLTSLVTHSWVIDAAGALRAAVSGEPANPSRQQELAASPGS
jgi:glutamate-5-semialdehyde dehydrogenase